MAAGLFKHYHISRALDGSALERNRNDEEVVCLAFDTQKQFFVNLHVLITDIANPSWFRKAGQEIQEIDSPSVAKLLEAGEDDGSWYYVTEHIDGESLKDYLSRVESIPTTLAAEIVTGVLESLASFKDHTHLLPGEHLNAFWIKPQPHPHTRIVLTDHRLHTLRHFDHKSTTLARDAYDEAYENLVTLLGMQGSKKGGFFHQHVNTLQLAERLETLLSLDIGLVMDRIADDIQRIRPDDSDTIPLWNANPKVAAKAFLEAEFPTDVQVQEVIGDQWRLIKPPKGTPSEFPGQYLLRATHRTEKRNAVIHLLPPKRLHESTLTEQVQISASHHDSPGLLPILDLAEIQQSLVYLESVVPGLRLARYLHHREKLTPKEVLLLLRELDQSLRAAQHLGYDGSILLTENIYLIPDLSHSNQPIKPDDLLSAPLGEWPGLQVVYRPHPTMERLLRVEESIVPEPDFKSAFIQLTTDLLLWKQPASNLPPALRRLIEDYDPRLEGHLSPLPRREFIERYKIALDSARPSGQVGLRKSATVSPPPADSAPPAPEKEVVQERSLKPQPEIQNPKIPAREPLASGSSLSPFASPLSPVTDTEEAITPFAKAPSPPPPPTYKLPEQETVTPALTPQKTRTPAFPKVEEDQEIGMAEALFGARRQAPAPEDPYLEESYEQPLEPYLRKPFRIPFLIKLFIVFVASLLTAGVISHMGGGAIWLRALDQVEKNTSGTRASNKGNQVHNSKENASETQTPTAPTPIPTSPAPSVNPIPRPNDPIPSSSTPQPPSIAESNPVPVPSSNDMANAPDPEIIPIPAPRVDTLPPPDIPMAEAVEPPAPLSSAPEENTQIPKARVVVEPALPKITTQQINADWQSYRTAIPSGKEDSKSKLTATLDQFKASNPTAAQLGNDDLELLRQIAGSGFPSAMAILSNVLKTTNPQESRQWLELAANAGDLASIISLAYGGESGDTSEEKIIEYAHQAAVMGSSIAMLDLGERYLNGNGVDKDPVQAVKFLRSAVEAGEKKAKDLLGLCYARGIGVERDYMTAVTLFQEAVNDGYVNSLQNLGVLYLQGHGVQKDTVKAVSLFQEGAMKNNAGCMQLLAHSLEKGIGIAQNLDEARRWYQASARLGNENSRAWCEENGISW